MATNVVDQLKEVESQLAAQISALNEQISATEEKRKGLQTVIGLFEGGGDSNGVAASVAEILTSAVSEVEVSAPEEPAPAKKPGKRRGRKPSLKTVAKAKAKAAAAPKVKATKTVAPKVAPATTRKPRGGKSPNWQRYVQDPFRKTPLPDVVANILKAQPDEAFKIAEVMEAIFKSDMPKATFLKARNRVSNILSAGARTNEWHRGRGGKYSMSSKALK
ncbi:MAG: hypothetical protein AAF821_24220 [Cyanobacteria bacterium P01_D01_bin.156]